MRTTRKSVTFARPFTLSTVDVALPAGTYVIETDEEDIGGMGFVAYRRVASSIQVCARGVTRLFPIDPVELAARLSQDAGPDPAGT